MKLNLLKEMVEDTAREYRFRRQSNYSSSTTTIITNDCCSLAFSQDAEDGLDGNSDSDFSQDCTQYTEFVQDKDADDAPLKTTSRNSATNYVPTDIAAGQD